MKLKSQKRRVQVICESDGLRVKTGGRSVRLSDKDVAILVLCWMTERPLQKADRRLQVVSAIRDSVVIQYGKMARIGFIHGQAYAARRLKDV